jgi:uncharacterized NAD(P)/FAD-binding protein YdhS
MSPQKDAFDVAVVGGGFSGACISYHILKSESSKVKIGVFDPRAEIGTGVAYGDCSQRHILNVRAKGMSIDDTNPQMYNRWLEGRGVDNPANLFTNRHIYKQYVQESLVGQSRQSQSSLSHLQSSIVSIKKSGPQEFLLENSSGDLFSSKAVVLALGVILANPKNQSGPASALTSPWNSKAFADVSTLNSIAVVGAGLTAVDVIVEAEYAGFKGKYSVVSRHAAFPRPHLEVPLSATPELVAWANSLVARKLGLRACLREFRQQVDSGGNWYQIIDALRAPTSTIWSQWSTKERRFFSKNLKWAWDIHRHQVPSVTMEMIKKLQSEDRLELIKGSLLESSFNGKSVTVKIKSKKTNSTLEIPVDRAFDGMGLGTNIAKSDNPLVRQMLSDGLISVDDVGLGLRASPEGRIVSGQGSIISNMFLMGPLRRGELWESTSVPELRVQGRIIAQEICSLFSQATLS